MIAHPELEVFGTVVETVAVLVMNRLAMFERTT